MLASNDEGGSLLLAQCLRTRPTESAASTLLHGFFLHSRASFYFSRASLIVLSYLYSFKVLNPDVELIVNVRPPSSVEADGFAPPGPARTTW